MIRRKHLPFEDELFPLWLCLADDDDDGTGDGGAGKAADDDGGPGKAADDGTSSGKAADDGTSAGKSADDGTSAGKSADDGTGAGTGDTGTAGEAGASFGSGSTDKGVAADDGPAAPGAGTDVSAATGTDTAAGTPAETASKAPAGAEGGGITSPAEEISGQTPVAAALGGDPFQSDFPGLFSTPAQAAGLQPGENVFGPAPSIPSGIGLSPSNAPIDPNALGLNQNPQAPGFQTNPNSNLPAWTGTIEGIPNANVTQSQNVVSGTMGNLPAAAGLGVSTPGFSNTLDQSTINAINNAQVAGVNVGPAPAAPSGPGTFSQGFADATSLTNPVANLANAAGQFAPGPAGTTPQGLVQGASPAANLSGTQPGVALGGDNPPGSPTNPVGVQTSSFTKDQTPAPSGPQPGGAPADQLAGVGAVQGGASPASTGQPSAGPTGPTDTGNPITGSQDVSAALSGADGFNPKDTSAAGGSDGLSPQGLIMPIPPAHDPPVPPTQVGGVTEPGESVVLDFGNLNPEAGIFGNPGNPNDPTLMPGGIPITAGVLGAGTLPQPADGGVVNSNANQGMFAAINNAVDTSDGANINPNQGII